MAKESQGRYKAIIEKVFFGLREKDSDCVEFEREDLVRASEALGLELPKNLGDVIYSIRYRTPLPESVRELEPEGMEWIIEGAGRSRYRFKLVPVNRIVPNIQLMDIKIPDSTPEIVNAYALSDEQALLAKLRYNRLVDIFLGISAYSLQNHLRTFVKTVGQVEIDEIYVAVDRHGRQFVLPVQAKGGCDQLSAVQTKQDIACCGEKYPGLICRPISAQFMDEDSIALFELAAENDGIKILDEKHYRLVPADLIDGQDLSLYNRRSSRFDADGDR